MCCHFNLSTLEEQLEFLNTEISLWSPPQNSCQISFIHKNSFPIFVIFFSFCVLPGFCYRAFWTMHSASQKLTYGYAAEDKALVSQNLSVDNRAAGSSRKAQGTSSP